MKPRPGFIDVRYTFDGVNCIAHLPIKEFEAFVDRHCDLGRLGERLQMQYAESDEHDEYLEQGD